MRDDCLIVAIRLYTGRILHLRTMATVVEKNLVIECYSWVVDEELLEGVKNSGSGGLLICEHANVILGDVEPDHEENPHRLDIIDAPIELRYTFCLVLVDTNEKCPKRRTAYDFGLLCLHLVFSLKEKNGYTSWIGTIESGSACLEKYWWLLLC